MEMTTATGRWWSTERSSSPGVFRRADRNNRFTARVSVNGKWVALGVFKSSSEALKITEIARRLKLEGAFKYCVDGPAVRAIVRAKTARE